MTVVRDIAALERAVGRRSLPALMKSIDRLDEHCTTLLAASPAAVLGYVDRHGSARADLVGGAPGFAAPRSPSRLHLPLPADAAAGTGVALLVLVPGWRETLRVNGRIDDGAVAVEEAFLHCGKAVIRSQLWDAPGAGPADPGVAAFLATAPFVVVTSRDGSGRADASPKGDPAGILRPVGPTTLALADRPGNQRTDTLHNLLECADVAILALTPGDDRVCEITGTATISTAAAVRESLAERGRVPKVALLIEVRDTRLTPSPAIRGAALWEPDRHVRASTLPRPSAVWADHVAKNETRGATATAVRAMAGERLLRAGLAADYRRNLY